MPPAPQRFALIAPNYYPLTCGVGDHTMRLAAELQRRGHEAVVFTHAPAAPNPEAPGVPVKGVAGQRSMSIAARVAKEILSQGFSQIIIQYTPQMWGAQRLGSPALPALAALLRSRGARITLVMHELAPPWNRRPDLALGAALMRLQLHAMLRSSDALFVTTESRRRLAGISRTDLPGVLRVGPNALPLQRPFVPGGHRVGLFSTLAVGKSFEVVVAAFEGILQVYPDAELLLIGDLGPRDGQRFLELEARIAASPGARRIRLTGKLTLAEIAQAVASLDVYLFAMNTGANTRSGTLPLALGSGVPVVAIRGPETDPLFVDRQNVFFAESLSGPAFAEGARQIFADPELAGRLSEGGRRLYRENLSWEKIVDTLLARLV
ncbi:MAG TPA: glycosyltransferase family 4 protein [Polyangia bacterium]|nr:glycosyltransferase family 4 protein [Polyangia bacterium]